MSKIYKCVCWTYISPFEIPQRISYFQSTGTQLKVANQRKKVWRYQKHIEFISNECIAFWKQNDLQKCDQNDLLD